MYLVVCRIIRSYREISSGSADVVPAGAGENFPSPMAARHRGHSPRGIGGQE